MYSLTFEMFLYCYDLKGGLVVWIPHSSICFYRSSLTWLFLNMSKLMYQWLYKKFKHSFHERKNPVAPVSDNYLEMGLVA